MVKVLEKRVTEGGEWLPIELFKRIDIVVKDLIISEPILEIYLKGTCV